jgi:release factor glutamine methyltransferase
LLSHPEYELSLEESASLEKITYRLLNGEPLPYILGHWEFYGLEFTINPSVLIPRPETELLVEEGLHWLKEISAKTSIHSRKGSLCADVGCGSGCIGISLAVHAPWLQVIASDISHDALQIAQANAKKHKVSERVACIQADLLSAVSQPFNLICANLPYIPEHTLRGLKLAKWEPNLALCGGQDGLSLIRRFLEQLQRQPGSLAPKGLILLEIESSLGQDSIDLAKKIFPYAHVRLLRDLAGLDRCVAIQVE